VTCILFDIQHELSHKMIKQCNEQESVLFKQTQKKEDMG